VITGRLKLHETGVLALTVDTDAVFYDSTAPWRARAMQGQLDSGELVMDVRSDQRCQVD